MGLKQGTLESLAKRVPVSIGLGDLVLKQMLMALDFLAVQDIVHRDVKPENILYVVAGDQPCFQLGDFGLSNRASIASTFAGSPLYMAPEMFHQQRQVQAPAQTHKVDVWSLFVTMLWTQDVGGFRKKSTGFQAIHEVRDAVLAASKVDSMRQLEAMARADPNQRASAAQMLVKVYKGEGLTTPRRRIPQLEPAQSVPVPGGSSPSSAAPPPAPRATIAATSRPSGPLGHRAALRQRRGLLGKSRDARPAPAAAATRPYRVRRTRSPPTVARISATPLRGPAEHGATEVAAAETRQIPGSFPGS